MAQSKRKALGGAVPVATLGQGGSCRPSRGRKESPRDPVATSSEARDGEPVQLDLFGDAPGYVGLVSKHPLYRVWASMMTRCTNPKDARFRNYGGRGITVDPVFRSSRAFIAWALANGWQPGLQIDRRDNDGPYSPGNCRFVTSRVNNRNRRDTVRLADGSPLIGAISAVTPCYRTVKCRVRSGMAPERALTAPLRGRRHFLNDGTPLGEAARLSGLPRATVYYRIAHGWTPDQAAGIAPPPQRRQNGAGRAQLALAGPEARRTRKGALAPAAAFDGGMKQLRTKVRKAK